AAAAREGDAPLPSSLARLGGPAGLDLTVCAAVCGIAPNAPSLRDRIAEWWRQNRALVWLRDAIAETQNERAARKRPPASPHLRSPLLSGLITDAAVEDPGCDIATRGEPADTTTPDAPACDDPGDCETRRRKGPAI